ARRVQGAGSPVLCPAVCNAGVGLMGPLETCTDQDMKNVFDVNLFGAIRTIQAFLPTMKRRRAGRIIVSSCGSAPGLPFNSVYCASKFAVEGLCESLAIVLRPFNIQYLRHCQGLFREEAQDVEEVLQVRRGAGLRGGAASWGRGSDSLRFRCSWKPWAAPAHPCAAPPASSWRRSHA
uniref:Uncharacterized protein n=1 Tax=Amazona collaria TaxID=241587 RepID=A0A8B9G4V1_9PSIT